MGHLGTQQEPCPLEGVISACPKKMSFMLNDCRPEHQSRLHAQGPDRGLHCGMRCSAQDLPLTPQTSLPGGRGRPLTPPKQARPVDAVVPSSRPRDGAVEGRACALEGAQGYLVSDPSGTSAPGLALCKGPPTSLPALPCCGATAGPLPVL